jgi:tetratricopeptide (TPR) repeat protein
MKIMAAASVRGRYVALLTAFLFTAELNSISHADRLLGASDREEAAQVRVAARTLADRGFALARHGQFWRAITFFNDAIAMDSSYSPAYYWRAGAFLQMKDFARALPDLNKVLELDPNYAAALNDRAFARWQTGDLVGALSDLNCCIALRADWGLPFANRAALKAIMGDSEGEAVDLSEALGLDPSLAKPNEQSFVRRIK